MIREAKGRQRRRMTAVKGVRWRVQGGRRQVRE
jgi:hypothetical protein